VQARASVRVFYAAMQAVVAALLVCNSIVITSVGHTLAQRVEFVFQECIMYRKCQLDMNMKTRAVWKMNCILCRCIAGLENWTGNGGG